MKTARTFLCRLATEDDGELYEDSAAPQTQPHYDEVGPPQPGEQPSYSEIEDGQSAVAQRPGSVVNQSYASLSAGTESAGTGQYNNGFPASGGAVAPADMLYLDTLLVAAPVTRYDDDSEEEI